MAEPHGNARGGLLNLVSDIYDCAIDCERWPAALERVTRLLDGASASISLDDTAKRCLRFKTDWNIAPAFEQAMADNLAINPLAPSKYFHDVDEPFSAMEFVGGEAYANCKWYRKALSPHGIGDTLITFLAKSDSRFGALSLFRESTRRPFSAADVDKLRVLAPHIRRSAMIADVLESRSLGPEMLGPTNAGIVLTDAACRIVHANRTAEQLMDAGALLCIEEMLSARHAQSAVELRDAITEADAGIAIGAPKATMSVVAKGIGGPDLAVWTLPLDGGIRREFGRSFEASVAVFIRKLSDTSPLPAELFMRRYAITPAECRLLVLLVQGATLKDAAETLGIPISIAKMHLALLFDRTGTRRESDLIDLAVTALAPASA